MITNTNIENPLAAPPYRVARLISCCALTMSLVGGCKSSAASDSENGGEGGMDGEGGSSSSMTGGGNGGQRGADDAGIVQGGANTGGSDDPGGAGPSNGGDGAGPVFAMATLTWTDEGPTGYVVLSDTLDMEDVALDEAREFPGYTSIGVAAGQLLVSPSAEDPTIERYRITDQLEWANTGTLSFVNEGAEAVGFYRQYGRRDRATYIDLDVTGRIVWDPAELAILGSRSDSTLPLQQEGLDLFANNNRTDFAFNSDVVRPFSYHDQDWLVWSRNSLLVVYDPATHEQKDVIDAPCPGLDSITRDEEGNTYFGTWEYSTLFPLMGIGAAPCVTRLKPDNTLDTDWNPDLTDMTGGRLLKNFRYLGQGVAVAGVLEVDEYGAGYDFSELAASSDDFWSTEGRFHRLWMFNLNDQTATPVTGIDFEFVQPYFSHAVIDGRYFVFLSDGGSNQSETTIVYELGLDASATHRFEVEGGVSQWLKVR